MRNPPLAARRRTSASRQGAVVLALLWVLLLVPCAAGASRAGGDEGWVSARGAAGAGPRASRVRIARDPKAAHIAVRVGAPFQLQAWVEAAGGARRRVDADVTWTSSDATVLRISDGGDGNPPGWATPLRPGVAGVAITYPRIDGAAGVGDAGWTGDSVLVVIEDSG